MLLAQGQICGENMAFYVTAIFLQPPSFPYGGLSVEINSRFALVLLYFAL